MAEEVKSEVKEEKPEKKNFFKTTSFKCIIVLLAIVLVCGILLTICNDLFEVTDEERLSRSVKKIYGSTVNYEYTCDNEIDDLDLTYSNGTIETTELKVTESETTTTKYIVVFKVLSYESTGETINDYLIKVTGTGGYPEGTGTVTCWVAFTMDEEFTEIQGIRSVSIDSNKNQSYISKIKSKNLEYFSEEFNGESYTSQLGTGASYSMAAITNAVNTAMEFINDYFTEPEGNNDIFAKSLTAVYGRETAYECIEAEGLSLEYTNGTIETTAIDVTNSDESVSEISVAAFKITEYNDYLIKVTGTGGFGTNGTVTCWIAFNMDENYENIISVRKVYIDSNNSQSFISLITDTVLDEAFSSYTGDDFGVLTDTGATYTMTAITNAVNTGMNFVTSVLGGAE